MYAGASGHWTDVACGSRCIQTPYPVSQVYYVSRNQDRKTNNTGITRQTMVPTSSSICWLSMVSFWQASAANEWAGCTARHNDVGDAWELQASVRQQWSKTGAECGAVCLSDLPHKSVSIGTEVVKQRELRGCTYTDLGNADTQHCFLTSMAVSNVRSHNQRPRCAVSVKGDSGERHWMLRTCNGETSGSKTRCGARCVAFTRS